MKLNKTHTLLGPIPFGLTIIGIFICIVSVIAISLALYVLFFST